MWSAVTHRAAGWLRFGLFNRLDPIGRVFGADRGAPIDRYYIERFLERSRMDVRGKVLEVGDNAYTRRYGDDRVERSDVLHATAGNPHATIVADLSAASGIPSNTFDCVILTQTLLCIYDLQAAVRTLHRILKPGGVVLVTTPGICQISRYDMDRWGDYWRLTSASAQRLFEDVFSAAAVAVAAHGNVKTAVAFLHGLAVEDLRRGDLDYRDRDYELVITIRAVKLVLPT